MRAPAVGIAAVIFDITRPLANERRVCLIRRRKPPRQGLWSFPGGRLELGETMAACAAREAKEETALSLLALDHARPCAAVDVIEHEPEPPQAQPQEAGGSGAEAASADNTATAAAEPARRRLAFHYCVVDFVAFAAGSPRAGDDASDARWVPAARVADHVEAHEGVQEAIDSALAMIDAGLVQWPEPRL